MKEVSYLYFTVLQRSKNLKSFDGVSSEKKLKKEVISAILISSRRLSTSLEGEAKLTQISCRQNKETPYYQVVAS